MFSAGAPVTVETWMGGEEVPVRLSLTGPRNYLLAERSQTERVGTSVRVRMREAVLFDDVQRFVEQACPRTEFPIVLESGERRWVHRGEVSSDVVRETLNPHTNEVHEIRAYPVARAGIEGEFYVSVRRLPSGRERWDTSASQAEWLEGEYPDVEMPSMPGGVICVNGMAVRAPAAYQKTAGVRVDYRSRALQTDLARGGIRFGRDSEDPLLEERWVELLSEHLRSVYEGAAEDWRYRQRLAGQFALPAFWRERPAMIPVVQDGAVRLLSLAEVTSQPTIRLITELARFPRRDATEEAAGASNSDGAAILRSHVDALCGEHAKALFRERRIVRVRLLSPRLVQVDWAEGGKDAGIHSARLKRPSLMRGTHVVGLGEGPLAIRVPVEDYYFHVVLNADHPFVTWMQNVWGAGAPPGFTATALPSLLERLCEICDEPGKGSDLTKYLNRWREADLPERFIPPPLDVTPEIFDLPGVETRGRFG